MPEPASQPVSVSEPRRHPRGGLYFEDFVVGELTEHRLTRTVTEMDNMLFSNMTLNPQPLHIDRHFCAETEWGQPLMNSLFTLGLMIGISVNDLTVGTTIANRSRGPMPASSNSCTRHSTRTASSSPNAGGRPSCASGLPDLVIPAPRSGDPESG
jgi:hypothetical protein